MSQYTPEADLFAGIEMIQDSPKDDGVLEMIVIRPEENERLVLEEVEVSARMGVHGDFWAKECWNSLSDGTPNPDVQVTLMNSRCIALLAREKSRWPLAGDQLYVDMELSIENLPVGQRLFIGSAVLEITAINHTGCGLFSERFGKAATRLVNSPDGKRLRLRGVYAKVVRDGVIKTGDRVIKTT
jgi:hypothetical protein